METFNIHILGCGSAKPSLRHNASCQVVDIRGKLYMIDCGEGAQVGFARQRLNMTRLGHIFISHNHGDHVFGLPGLISTMGLLGRTADLHVHGPQQVEALLNVALQTYCQGMEYEVHFHPIDTTRHQIVFEDRSMEVWSLPLKHRVPCCGYLFREKAGLPHIRREVIDAYGIPVSQINNIKAGASWTLPDGTIIPHELLTTPPTATRSYAYCSDTAYMPELAALVRKTNLLYHEATYPAELELRADEYMHSTSRQAARTAADAHVGQLCIGHFSGRIQDEEAHLRETQETFQNTVLAREGMVICVK
ncbi:MAG: ribonuclease Z [Bacteroidaceae bacterium]|nr:ribonuclease Z [Bacteroidaceae bacterium]